ncbi:protein phosphatase 2C domain-containing protein [Herbiconiux sp. CPCC 205716]|uniref:Protein phosphatase 2C domain-containing protein n=1 Tax=Herbiconiux gentiana TaxID=2970912 RepID=A0ABT2GB34_9MICO|nr:protein phosphatase 2C domain-containing protein [Herbiconiux gentiana]MCS5713399.1 protein phosphatase 2C domain-containing protein [Herbiconiux gentiana]
MTQIGRTSARVSVTRKGAVPRQVTLSWAAISDKGNKRAGNEDSSISDIPIFAVADGMGGHSAGDVASAAVVDRLGEIGDAVTTADRIEEALAEALTDIDRVGDESVLGTGTTVTGVALAEVDDDLAWMVFNIGDSRVYLLQDGQLHQLTVDHSVVQELLDAGLITPEQAERHPDSNVITRAVGFHEKPVPDYSTISVIAGQRVLICSDGLTKELTDVGIRHYLSISPTAERAANELVAASLANGGRDNVTVVVVDVESDENDGAPAGDVPERPGDRGAAQP